MDSEWEVPLQLPMKLVLFGHCVLEETEKTKLKNYCTDVVNFSSVLSGGVMWLVM